MAQKIISLQPRFFWGVSGNKRALATVKWSCILLLKVAGGLSMGDILLKNATLLYKWWWRFATEEEPLWKRFCLLAIIFLKEGPVLFLVSRGNIEMGALGEPFAILVVMTVGWRKPFLMFYRRWWIMDSTRFRKALGLVTSV